MEYQSEEMQSKYALALSKYNTHLHDDEVQAKVDNLITKHLDENNNIEVKKELFGCIDLTSLKCTDSEESIMKLTEKVNEFVDKYPDLDNVAAICVYPNMAEIVNDTLEADDVKIAAFLILVAVLNAPVSRMTFNVFSPHTSFNSPISSHIPS